MLGKSFLDQSSVSGSSSVPVETPQRQAERTAATWLHGRQFTQVSQAPSVLGCSPLQSPFQGLLLSWPRSRERPHCSCRHKWEKRLSEVHLNMAFLPKLLSEL